MKSTITVLAGLGIMLIGQIIWFAFMTYSANQEHDRSVSGAYCVVWIFGIPFVALISAILFSFLYWLSEKE